MEEAAKRYARWVLAVHLLLLVGVLVLVFAAARETYQRAREQVLSQLQDRQELLGSQTAQAVQDHYNAILASLQLIRRAEEREAAADSGPDAAPAARGLPTMRTARVLWRQLDQRAVQLLVVRRSDMAVGFALPQGSDAQGQAIARDNAAWLQGVQGPVISDFLQLPSGGGNLVAVPFRDDYVIVAVVPIDIVAARFLDIVNAAATLSATLIDGAGHTMVTSDRTLVGSNVYEAVQDEVSLDLLRRYMADPRMTSARIETPIEVGGIVLPPRLITALPLTIRSPGGAAADRPWTLLMASHLSEVDTLVRATFGRALIWAVIVGLSLTVILVSTAIQMIRARIRLERLRNEAIRRELDQARQIQLAWLPAGNRQDGPVRIAAVNQAANHISGDFYDWFDLNDGRTVVTIGDVTGHGMSAAFLMATTQLLVRNTMPRLLDPGACLSEVNRQLCNQVFSGQFVTMLIVVLDLNRGKIQAAMAGHFPPLLSRGGSFSPLEMEPQLVLGIEPDERFPTEEFDLPEQASILLYTDGVPDAANRDGDRYGYENLLRALEPDARDAEMCINMVLRSIATFRGERDIVDDLTMVAIRLEGAGVAHSDPAPEAAGV